MLLRWAQKTGRERKLADWRVTTLASNSLRVMFYAKAKLEQVMDVLQVTRAQALQMRHLYRKWCRETGRNTSEDRPRTRWVLR